MSEWISIPIGETNEILTSENEVPKWVIKNSKEEIIYQRAIEKDD